MRARPASDPTSWIYQANIHGTSTVPASPGWSSCRHGSYFFLAWHRMYLYWFERILRHAAGDPTLAIPYWDYADPEQRVVPAPFRDPASPLYVAERNRGVNAGERPSSQLDPIFDHSRAFGASNFSHTGSDVSFGGQQTPEAPHAGGGAGLLENTPHNQVHTWIGGRMANDQPGWMGTVEMAARDPLFWLHHANIDRLWKRWLDLGGGRENPLDGDWLNDQFTFFDERGQPVVMSGQQILDTAGQLLYRYDDDPAVASRTAPANRSSSASPRSQATPARRIVGKSGEGIDLGPQALTVAVTLTGKLGKAAAAGGPKGGREAGVVLTLDGVEGLGVPGVSYEIYVDPPRGRRPTSQDPSFVGSLGLFGLQPWDARAMGAHRSMPPAKQSFDVTRQVSSSASDPGRDALDVTLVPRDLDPTAPAPPGRWARVQRLTVSVKGKARPSASYRDHAEPAGAPAGHRH